MSVFQHVLRVHAMILAASMATSADIVQTESVDVAPVWAGHPLDFAMVTKGQNQFVAYYDTARRMTVAKRTIGSTSWIRTILPTTVGWDSHNGIAMALDDSDYIHVSGNMHNVALIYFRSNKPLDIAAFTKLGMTGTTESSMTYPVFVTAPNGQLFFQFRDGGSGNGTTLWNVYSSTAKKWTRVGTTGLFDGLGLCNAYPSNPVMGPDGMFHVVWMWRETPVANTNHDLSHIRTSDLVNWQTISGKALTLPITPNTAGVVIDSVDPGHGLTNMDFGIGWDAQKRPVASYHRYNADSISQIFDARYENGRWAIHQTSAWKSFKWNLDLQGSLAHVIAADPVRVEDGELVQPYVYRDGIRRKWILDPVTLAAVRDTLNVPAPAKASIYVVQSTFDSMTVRTIEQGEWILRWETLPTNQDLARTKYPSSSMMRLYRFATAPVGVERAAPASVRIQRQGVSLRIPRPEGATTWSATVHTLDGHLVARTGMISANEARLALPRVKGQTLVVRIGGSAQLVAAY